MLLTMTIEGDNQPVIYAPHISDYAGVFPV
jgi:hypothetical protein